MALADPAACLIGKRWPLMKLYQKKTLGGSLAFFIVAVFLTLLLGLLMPVGLILLMDQLNDKIVSRHDVTSKVAIPVLGELIHIPKRKTKGTASAVPFIYRVDSGQLQDGLAVG